MKTVTTETPETAEVPRMLADMMKERPSDFDFSHVKSGPLRGTVQIGERRFTMTEMLGEFELVKRDQVTGQKFYGRKPKMNGLRRLVERMDAPLGEVDSVRSSYDVVAKRLAEIAAMILFVPNGDLWRPATEEEIGDAFEMKELQAVNDRFSGLKAEETEGNATSTPTTP